MDRVIFLVSPNLAPEIGEELKKLGRCWKRKARIHCISGLLTDFVFELADWTGPQKGSDIIDFQSSNFKVAFFVAVDGKRAIFYTVDNNKQD